MTNPLESLKEIVSQSVSMLVDLKSVLLSYQHSDDNSCIKASIADIDTCINHGNDCIKNMPLYRFNNFRFYKDLVNLADSIIDNDFGIILSQRQEAKKRILCKDIIAIIDEMIAINNMLKENAEVKMPKEQEV